jgi:hypothetical protein
VRPAVVDVVDEDAVHLACVHHILPHGRAAARRLDAGSKRRAALVNIAMMGGFTAAAP